MKGGGYMVAVQMGSPVVDLFTRDYGRVAAVAKGARRPHSSLRGVLLQFQPLAAGLPQVQPFRDSCLARRANITA